MAQSKKTMKKLGGIGFAVSILRALPPSAFKKKLLGSLEKVAPAIAGLFESSFFLFEDLKRLDSKSLLSALKIIPEEKLLLAMKLASADLRQHILSHMSEGNRKKFLESYLAQPKVHKAKVIRAQMEISRLVRKEIENGKMSVRG